MLLQALHKYAQQQNLLANLPFQRRIVHLLIPLKADGSVRGEGFVPLSTPVVVKGNAKEEPGRELLLPRFPGENNGGKAYYLAESFNTILGVRRESGETLPCEPLVRSDRNPVGAHKSFWQRITDAWVRTNDPRLSALLLFRQRYLCARLHSGLTPPSQGSIWAVGLGSPVATDERANLFDWLNWQPNERARDKAPEWHGRFASTRWEPLSKLNVCGFEVDGVGLHLGSNDKPFGLDDQIWQHWVTTYTREAFTEEGDAEETTGSGSRRTICLVSGEIGEPVARSHKPKILGVPGLASGGYVVSFAKEAPAFSSFGFEMGDNAPVSEKAAAAYALALNALLASDDTSFGIGEVKFCFWSEKQSKQVGMKISNLIAAKPKAVRDFLKNPFFGIDRSLVQGEHFFSVALSANSGRVVVRDWLRVPLENAIKNFARWFRDLEIASLGQSKADDDEKSGPYSLFRLAATAVRDSSELKRVNEVITALYRCAIDNLPVPIRLLAPVLAEFRSALVTDSKKKPTFPFNQARFALLKLILTRNPNGGVTLMPHLCDTDDAAYNLGRLLCLLASLQKAAHRGEGKAAKELEGPGIVERYYGTASSAPATVFPVLLKLHQHHLRKLEQKGDKGRRIANARRSRIAEIVSKFPASGPVQPPHFPRQLSLEAQGRFALGFYQQMAADQQARREAAAKKVDSK
jgi:CRISPR-associated protein Csd1